MTEAPLPLKGGQKASGTPPQFEIKKVLVARLEAFQQSQTKSDKALEAFNKQPTVENGKKLSKAMDDAKAALKKFNATAQLTGHPGRLIPDLKGH